MASERSIPYDVKACDPIYDPGCDLVSRRKEWNDELPFIMTQLAPYGEALPPGGRYYPVIRDAQEAVVKKLPQVYCASIGDVGNWQEVMYMVKIFFAKHQCLNMLFMKIIKQT